MNNRERIKILRNLKDNPLPTLHKDWYKVEESLNWAIKVCSKYESKRDALKNDICY